MKRFGKDRKGNQRFRCKACGKTVTELPARPIENMTLPEDKMLLCLKLLVDGVSIRAIERITEVHRDTVLKLLVAAGEKCDRLMTERIQNISVKDVQCDEAWAYVFMKEKTKTKKGKDDPKLGDAYTFVAMERHTKLVLTWHLGRRTNADTIAFTDKLARATAEARGCHEPRNQAD
jgi:hypothetical protein